MPGLRSPMVGRDRELELLGSLLRRAVEEARGHLVTIYGDPGVGKSRLVAEFTAQAGARVVRGRCLPYGDGITFWPLAEIVKAEAGVLDNDPPDVALERITALGASAPELAEFLPALIHTIGLDDPSSPLRGLSPRAVMNEIHVGWRGFFTTLAGDDPLVVVVEDIHWADGAMLDLLEELPDRIPAPVVFLCPARPELDDPPGELGRRASQRVQHRARAPRRRRRRPHGAHAPACRRPPRRDARAGSSSGPRETRSSSRRSCAA